MRIWKLTVLDPHIADWDLSIYKGGLIVRAENEHQARMKASQEFGIAGRAISGQRTRYSPWSQDNVVSCEPYSGSEFPVEGEPSVLELLDD